MPIIKSAKKRVKQASRANERNNVVRQKLRTALKAFSQAVSSKKNVSETLKDAQSAIDQAAKKGIMHKNKAARKKSQLATKAKSVNAKPAATTKKPATKKPAAKKTAVKKPAAKKTTSKK
jgi:small subunit ribosomal protein S20